MGNLHRTQVYIEEDQIHRLKLEAEKEHVAVSELIRRAIERHLDKEAKSINWDRDPLTKAVGEIRLSVTNVSENHDRYLYGQKKKK